MREVKFSLAELSEFLSGETRSVRFQLPVTIALPLSSDLSY